MSTSAGADAGEAVSGLQARHRYFAVFLIVLVLLIFEILAPNADWARALDVALVGAALSVTVATSRARAEVRRMRTLIVSTLALVVVLGVATGLFSKGVTFVVFAVLLALIPISLAGGLLRLIREKGVTFQVVAGALAIYLVVGLLFAAAIAFVAEVGSGSYFKQGAVSTGIGVYYSFTVLTTTGFGDYTAAHSAGRALAVLEMLTGQLYLVTVIGILVGNFAGRRMGSDSEVSSS
jgi:hypothetical protein